MAGTISGAKKATQKILERNPNHFRDIGAKGGKATGRKGFAISGKQSSAGATGGRRGKKGFSFIVETSEYMEYIDKTTNEIVKFYK